MLWAIILHKTVCVKVVWVWQQSFVQDLHKQLLIHHCSFEHVYSSCSSEADPGPYSSITWALSTGILIANSIMYHVFVYTLYFIRALTVLYVQCVSMYVRAGWLCPAQCCTRILAGTVQILSMVYFLQRILTNRNLIFSYVKDGGLGMHKCIWLGTGSGLCILVKNHHLLLYHVWSLLCQVWSLNF